MDAKACPRGQAMINGRCVRKEPVVYVYGWERTGQLRQTENIDWVAVELFGGGLPSNYRRMSPEARVRIVRDKVRDYNLKYGKMNKYVFYEKKYW